jgi:hypothetical protein
MVYLLCDQQLFRSKKALKFSTYVDRLLECMEDIFVKTRSNEQQYCMSILRYWKHHYESKMNLLCSEIKTIFALKFYS